MLGLAFPAGPALEKLARQAVGRYKPRAVIKGLDCHLSGVENQCRDRMDKGEPPEEVALFCLMSVLAAVDGMTAALLERFGKLPLVYAGGVMSNGLLRDALQQAYQGSFAPPAFSADNAAGIALLCSVAEQA
jgi:N6-L-threonylcarbamoyladenine synthase